MVDACPAKSRARAIGRSCRIDQTARKRDTAGDLDRRQFDGLGDVGHATNAYEGRTLEPDERLRQAEHRHASFPGHDIRLKLSHSVAHGRACAVRLCFFVPVAKSVDNVYRSPGNRLVRNRDSNGPSNSYSLL